MMEKEQTALQLIAGAARCPVYEPERILDLMEKLGIVGGECTPDGKFSLDACRCVGACGLAPVMMINDEVYGKLTVEDLDGILEKYQ